MLALTPIQTVNQSTLDTHLYIWESASAARQEQEGKWTTSSELIPLKTLISQDSNQGTRGFWDIDEDLRTVDLSEPSESLFRCITRTPQALQKYPSVFRPSFVGRVHTWSFDWRSFDRGKIPSAGKIADVPNADADCFWHWVQWQWYKAIGSA